MKFAILFQAFDGRDFFALRGAQRRAAGSYREAIQEHRAGSALAFAAPILRSGEVKFIAQNIQQWPLSVTFYRVSDTIDIELHHLYCRSDWTGWDWPSTCSISQRCQV